MSFHIYGRWDVTWQARIRGEDYHYRHRRQSNNVWMFHLGKIVSQVEVLLKPATFDNQWWLNYLRYRAFNGNNFPCARLVHDVGLGDACASLVGWTDGFGNVGGVRYFGEGISSPQIGERLQWSSGCSVCGFPLVMRPREHTIPKVMTHFCSKLEISCCKWWCI